MTESGSIESILKDQKDFFFSGKTLNIKERKGYLARLRQMLKENEDRIADAVYKDFGKSYFKVIENELCIIYEEISRARRNLNKWSSPDKPWPSLVNIPGKARVYPQPYGSTLIIGPWNYPVMLSINPVVGAFAAGNTVILKPSELTKHTSALLSSLVTKYFPQSLFYVREGGVEETQELLSLRFDKIFFTGSTAVGRIVMKAASEYLTPVTLELGGKNPVIVLPDCNLKMTAKRLVWGKFHNGGQACVCPDHIYVHQDIEEALIEEIKRFILKFFNGEAEKSGILPLIIDDSHFERLIALIDPGKVILGGRSDKAARYIEPTVLAGVKEEDPIMQEEVFGPLMPILSFDSLDDLLIRLRNKPSPLAMYIFTGNIKKAKKIQREFRSGGGMINDNVVHFVNSSTPFGGFGESGMGAYHGKAGFECFSHRKTVLKKPTWFDLWLKYPPYSKRKLWWIRQFLR